MYISRFQVVNYKSFREPKALEFTQGFNIISGQNNAGKTALLEALGLTFTARPHRSIKTVPSRDAVLDESSRADVSFTLPGKELKELMATSPGSVYAIAKPTLESPFARKIGFIDDSQQSIERLFAAIFSQDPLSFRIRFQVAVPGHSPSFMVPEVPSYGLYPAQGPINNWYCVNFQVDRVGQTKLIATHANSGSDMGHHLAGSFQKHVYRFSAERMNVGKGPHGHSTVLAQNASNLHEVLSQLQHNTSRFREFNHQLNAILPQVRQVSVRGIGPGQVEIVVWCHDPETQREDLVIPLTESGTGIGQVLGIMYAVMTSERPQTIIVDEPQSFLHPGAARKLIDFLKQYPQHQFIVATHSATIIAATNPKTITLARFEDSESTLQQLDAVAEKGIQATLAELGIRFSDSFGADSILWVEGRTEEKCFPLIVEKIITQDFDGDGNLGYPPDGRLRGS